MFKLLTRNIVVLTATYALAVFFCFISTGCEESPDTAVSKESAQNVNTAQRMTRASREKLVLTEQEIARAGEIDTLNDRNRENAEKRQADKVVKRLAVAEETDYSVFDAEIAEIDKLGKQIEAGATEVANEFSDRLLSVTEELLRQHGKIGSLATAENKNRLAKAETILKNTIKTIKKNKNAFKDAKEACAVQTGPEMAIGTLYMIRAGDTKNELIRQRPAIGRILTGINQLAGSVKRQSAYVSGLKRIQPADAIALLQIELKKAQDNIVVVKKTLAELESKQSAVKQELDSNSSQASRLRQEYLALLDEADHSRGEKRFQLQTKAYELRVGTDQNLGSIHYETKAELARNEAAIVLEQISYQQNRRGELERKIDKLSSSIENLQSSSATTTNLTKAVAESVKEKADMVKSLLALLDKFEKAQDAYSQLRAEAVPDYTAAIYEFTEYGKLAAKSKNFDPKRWGQIAKKQLADLWLSDAAFYDSAAQVLALAEGIPEAQQRITYLVNKNKSQADQARASAAEQEK